MGILWGLSTNNEKPDIHSEQITKALHHIDLQWHHLTVKNKKDKDSLIGLPNPYIIPSTNSQAKFNFEEQYYWDTFFIALGLTKKHHAKLLKGMIENLAYLYQRFGMIPNASRMYFTSRSQPPLFTTLIQLYKDRFGCKREWYVNMMQLAELEYATVWMGKKHPHWRRIGQLNRYYDVNGLHDLAEAESGWDMTPRFDRKCLDYYPVDLNALLFKYEMDFSRFYKEEMDDIIKAGQWKRKAEARAQSVDELLWGRNRSFYFDYDFIENRRGATWSLAGFLPMWANMVDHDRAKQLVGQLKRFEKAGGLTTTTHSIINMSAFGSIKTQWAYPNGWAPLHWFVIRGLQNYGYQEEADRIAKKWLKTNIDWFNAHGVFQEKYNVVNPSEEPVKGIYPNQSGFGWTNGVFIDLLRDFA